MTIKKRLNHLTPPGTFLYVPPNRHRCNHLAILELLGKSQPLNRAAIATALEKPIASIDRSIQGLLANGEIKPTTEGYILSRG